jgi:hypothetical protein
MPDDQEQRKPREQQPQPPNGEQNKGYPNGDDVTRKGDHGRSVG